MPNVWKCKVKDKDGKPVELSPGQKTLVLRGPTTMTSIKLNVAILLDSKRRDAIDAGFPDPGYQVDGEIEPVESQPVDQLNFGLLPPGASPLQLPTDSKTEAE